MGMSGIEIGIASNLKQLIRDMEHFVADQLPFATVDALTQSARKAKDRVRKSLNKRFELRSKYSVNGITIQRAEKRDWPNAAAYVGVDKKRAYLADHEQGKVRKPKGSSVMAIPTRAINRTSSGRIRKAQRAGALRAAGKTYRPEGKDVVLRKAKGRGAARNLKVMYALSPQVKIKGGRLRLEETVRKHATRILPAQFKRSMREAVRSRRSNTDRLTTSQARTLLARARGRR